MSSTLGKTHGGREFGPVRGDEQKNARAEHQAAEADGENRGPMKVAGFLERCDSNARILPAVAASIKLALSQRSSSDSHRAGIFCLRLKFKRNGVRRLGRQYTKRQISTRQNVWEVKEMGQQPGPAAEAEIRGWRFSAGLKSSFPLLKQGAPTGVQTGNMPDRLRQAYVVHGN